VTALAGKRILVVEDEAMVAAMVEDMLVELGATVVGPAGSVAKGLDLARNAALDGAVLDVNLRGERVDAVAALLRERHVPLVFASGYGESGFVPRQGERVLEKPFALDELGRALGELMAP
jgi:CheY-like chemotaxis protein